MLERYLIEARNVTLAVEDGRIAEPCGRYETVVRLPDADLRPGLINAHDHLHRNHYGRLGRPPYANACEWARDIQARERPAIEAGRKLERKEALLRGAWKNLCAGVTTVVHHDPWEPDFERDFPIRVVPLPSEDSLGMDAALDAARLGRPWALHLAEGIDRPAADEVRQLYYHGALGPNLIAVHGVGMDPEAIRQFRASGAALVWCPSSNLFLFGRTAPSELLEPGIDVLLGSDSMLTGAGDLLDELRCARSLGLVDDQRLLDAVGATAARRLGVRTPSLEVGAPADLAAFSSPLLDATADDVELVVVGGMPRVVSPPVFETLELAGARGFRVNRRPSARRPAESAISRPFAEPIPALAASTR